MQSVGGWSGILVSWSEFFLFHVLPTAIAQIYDWLREWQILVAALLVLAFFHFWSRTILRAARREAKEIVQSETRAFGASLKLLRRQMELKAQPPATAAVGPSQPEPRAVRSPPASGQAAIEHLRQSIRLALGTIPLSDEPLSPEGTRLYKAAIGAFAGVNEISDAPQGVLQQILSELGALEQSFPPASCRQAWQSLVKVNALAREFQEPVGPRAATS